MTYYGSRNNGKSFLKAMIEPSKWSSSEDTGSISTAYSVPRDVQWLIQNFCKAPDSDLLGTVSSEFHFQGQEWKLQIWLEHDKEYIELNLLRSGPSVSSRLVVSFGIKRADGSVETVDKLERSMDFACHGWTLAVTSRALLRTRLRKEMASSKMGDCLTLYCQMSVVGSPSIVFDALSDSCTLLNSPTILDPPKYMILKPASEPISDGNSKQKNKIENEEQLPISKPIFTLIENLKDLYTTGKGCDVEFKVQSKSLTAHRAILEARSPVLSSLLSENSAEPEKNVVSVEDCDPEAFEIFLIFLYSGTTENLTTDNVMFVYYVADKYQIPELKCECVQYMMSNLSISNVCGVLCLASRHDEKVLLEDSNDFFQQNAKEIFSTSEFEKFMVENTSKAKELIVKFANTL